MLHTITLSSQRIHGHPCLLLHVPFHIQIPPVSGDGNHHSYPWSKPDAAFAKMSAPMRPAWGEPRWPSYAVPLFGPRAAADDATLEQCPQVNFSFTSARWLGTWECTWAPHIVPLVHHQLQAPVHSLQRIPVMLFLE